MPKVYKDKDPFTPSQTPNLSHRMANLGLSNDELTTLVSVPFHATHGYILIRIEQIPGPCHYMRLPGWRRYVDIL